LSRIEIVPDEPIIRIHQEFKSSESAAARNMLPSRGSTAKAGFRTAVQIVACGGNRALSAESATAKCSQAQDQSTMPPSNMTPLPAAISRDADA